MVTIPFSQLEGADLIVDAVYEGNASGNLSDDPIARLLKAGNAGHFRYCGSLPNPKYAILCALTEDQDWQDRLDVESGIFVCYGDNRKPGRDLHDTPLHLNAVLRNLFDALEHRQSLRKDVPPLFLFSKHPTTVSPRSVQFKGVCAPGALHVAHNQALTSVWKIMNGQRFQNYRATFTILDIPVVRRQWIEALEDEQIQTGHAPLVWNMWLKSGFYRPLQAKHTTHYRTVDHQLPRLDSQKALLLKIYRHFHSAPARFAYFAADVARMSDERVLMEGVTRNILENGYEAFGRYRLGPVSDPVHMGFILEGKCYHPGFGQKKRRSVGIKETSRFIARLKNRFIGILVTTSVIAEQAYQQVRAEKHPLIFLSGSDIVNILCARGIDTVKALDTWLSENYSAPL